jgi:hypothetical protein
MNLQSIISDWLKQNGYDGLLHAYTCCGCSLDDFMPCGEPKPDCEPGYANPVCECGGECDVGIYMVKPGTNP